MAMTDAIEENKKIFFFSGSIVKIKEGKRPNIQQREKKKKIVKRKENFLFWQLS